MQLCLCWRTRWRREGFAIGTFIVIERVLNSTSRVTIEAALRRHEVPSSIKKWVHYMLEDQTITINKGEISHDGRVISGCPQGAVLSLLLWNLVVNELIGEIEGQRSRELATGKIE